MSTHQHDRSNQHQSNQHSQNEANKTAPSAADQDRSHASHGSRQPIRQGCGETAERHVRAEELGSSQGEHRHNQPRKDLADKQASGYASRSAGHDERTRGGSRKQ